MKRAGTIGIAVAVSLMFGTPSADCQISGLTVAPELIEARYCANRSGALELRAEVQFTYQNTSKGVIILPLFAQVVEYSLFADKEALMANRSDGQWRSEVRRLFDERKLNQSRPGEDLFHLLAPGDSQSLRLSIFVPLLPPSRRGIKLLGTDQYLRVEINQWFGNRRLGEDLQRRWRDVGLLWIDNVMAEPLKLHIEEDPPRRACPVRVD